MTGKINGNYKVDFKETLEANFIQMCVFLLGIFFMAMYITIFQQMMGQFSTPEMKLISLFVFAWSTIKGVSWLQLDIEVCYKSKDESNE